MPSGHLPVLLSQEWDLQLCEFAHRRSKGGVPPVQVCVDVEGPLDTDRLRSALNHLVADHPALRTSIVADPRKGGSERRRALECMATRGIVAASLFLQSVKSDVDVGPVQLVTYDVETTDTSTLGALRAALNELGAIDTARPPLLKAVQIKYSRTRHMIVLLLPRCVCDQQSTSVLVRDLHRRYNDVRSDAQAASTQHIDDLYADAIREAAMMPSSEAGEAHSKHWERRWTALRFEQLDAKDIPSALPNSMWVRMKYAVKETVWLALRPEELASLTALTPAPSMFALFAATGGLMLSRCTARRRLPLWIVFPGRLGAAAHHDLVGSFAVSHILEVDRADGCREAEFMRRVGDGIADALPHQQYPLEALWQRLGVRHDIGFRLECALYDEGDTHGDGATGSVIFRPAHFTEARLTTTPMQLSAHVSDAQFMIGLSYSSALFTRQAATDLISVAKDSLMALVGALSTDTCGSPSAVATT